MKLIELTDKTVDIYLNNRTKSTVIIDFWSTTCNPCKAMMPFIEQIADEYSDLPIAKLNVNDFTELADAFGVYSVPTIVIFKNGKEVDRLIGLKSKSNIKDFIDKNL